MKLLRLALLAVVLALQSTAAHAQTLRQLTRSGATLGDSSLTFTSDTVSSTATFATRAASIAQLRKALSKFAFDSLVVGSGPIRANGATILTSNLTYGGVTLSNAVTGTGNMVLSANPTVTGTFNVQNIASTGGVTTFGQAGAATSTHTFRVFTDQNFNITTNGGTQIRALTDVGGYAPLLISGTTIALQISGVAAVSINASSAVTFAGALSGITTLAGTGAISGFTSLALSAGISGVTTLSMSGALTYGGVALSAAVTGTGNMVLSASPTLTGTLTAATVVPVQMHTGTGSSSFTSSAFSDLFQMAQPSVNLGQVYCDGNNNAMTFIASTSGASGNGFISTITASSPTLGSQVISLRSQLVVQFEQTSGSAQTCTWWYVRIA